MSDFLSSVLAADTVIERDVTIDGQTGPVRFRRLSAGQRLELVAGRKIQVDNGKVQALDIDLGDNELEKQKLVHFCVLGDGTKPRFASLADVKKLPAHVVEALAAVAQEINRDGDTASGDAAGEA